MDNPFNSPSVLSLCPGILGLERGVERAIGKLRVAAYVEIEAFIIANLVTAMESGFLDPVPVWSDVKTFNAQPFRDKVHGVIGGYPCQPFSNAGLRLGENDERHLWPYIREIVRTTKPVWCFFENVRGHLSLGFDVVYRELSEMGYNVKAGIFSAEEVGATHKRERLFILAVGNATSTGRERYRTEYRLRKSCKENETSRASNAPLANSTSLRSEAGLSEPGQREERFAEVTNDGSYGSWPAGQGSYQHEWEEPRAVEPGVGCTVDGYNFRTDLLRAYGNAVVEQTAALAFRTLLEKHLR